MRWSEGDWLGIGFFFTAAALSLEVLMERISFFGILNLLHNVLIGILFCVRKHSDREDPVGLMLALVTVSWPMGVGKNFASGIWEGSALFGMCLILWSLVTLGRSFGLAPADRGLVQRGPYRIVRHPMYLGELIYQISCFAGSFSIVRLGLLLGFVGLEIIRILREERLIAGYDRYSEKTRWRLLPGIW